MEHGAESNFYLLNVYFLKCFYVPCDIAKTEIYGMLMLLQSLSLFYSFKIKCTISI